MTLPIPSNVFADGELITEASLYARVFTAINTIYSQLTTGTVSRIQQTTFGTDLVSTGATEVVGYSQAVSLTSGGRYRVHFKGYMNGGTAGNIGGVRVRFDTAAVTNASALAGTIGTINHATSGGTGRGTCAFFAEFVAPSTAVYNIAIGVLTFSGAGNETILGTIVVTEVTVDYVGT